MTVKPILAPTLAAAFAASVLSPALAASTPSTYQHEAKITMAQARAIALKAMPGGNITAAELEKENGGSGLRYSFDVKAHGKTYEIGVDAKTGKILEKSVEGANPD